MTSLTRRNCYNYPRFTKKIYFFQSLNGESRYVIVDQKIFTFFKAETLNSGMQSATDKLLLFSSPVTRHSGMQSATKKLNFVVEVTTDFSVSSQKSKIFSVDNHVRSFLLFFLSKTSRKYDFLKPKIRYFHDQIITQKIDPGF